MDNKTVVNIAPDLLARQIGEVVFNKLAEEKDKEEEKLLSVAETCKIFSPGLAKSTLSQWTTQGVIPAYRIGGRVFYKKSEVMAAAKQIKRYDRNKQSITE